ncbi:MAG: GNAT family N-acetyltransferase [Cyanobacteria bacterium SBLK]|nr:GNAT family N-acetyltransferase [Cyanobacteria bacterium SBLK]
MFLLYPLLRLGISEDLRVRLRSGAPYYSCLTAISIVDAPRSPKTRQAIPSKKEVAGIVEIALRSRNNPTLDNPANLLRDESHSEQLPDRDRFGNHGRYPREYLYISNLAVSPIYRRQGIARKLLLSCEPLALQWGYQEIYLHVLERNERAKQLYLSLNYNLDRVEPHQSPWLWSRRKCLLLRKSLVAD